MDLPCFAMFYHVFFKHDLPSIHQALLILATLCNTLLATSCHVPRPVTLHALMDGSQYALAAQSGRKSLAATLGRPNEEGQRSSQVELRFGQVGSGQVTAGGSNIFQTCSNMFKRFSQSSIQNKSKQCSQFGIEQPKEPNMTI